LAQKYRVSNIPAFMIFKGGEPVDSFVGALSADDLCDRIDANL